MVKFYIANTDVRNYHHSKFEIGSSSSAHLSANISQTVITFSPATNTNDRQENSALGHVHTDLLASTAVTRSTHQQIIKARLAFAQDLITG